MSGIETDYYSRPYDLVRNQIQDMSTRADAAAFATVQAINDLKGVSSLFSEQETPRVDETVFTDLSELDLAVRAAQPQVRNFGAIDGFAMPSITDLSFPDIDAGDVPTFNPSFTNIALPNAPAPIDMSGRPSRPTLSPVSVPTAPTLSLPALGSIEAISIPTFAFPELPTFDGTAPSVDFIPPSSVLIWSEPIYASTSLDEIRAQVSTMLAGGTGIPPAIEAALFDRARIREDVVALKARQEAVDSFAGRGFTMPPGMLVAQVNAIVEDNQLKAGAINRDILNQSAQWEIDNLRFAVQQGMAIEGVLMNLFQQMAQRTFEAARYKVESEIALYNARVGLFNAQQNAYQVAATVFKIRIEGALAKIEAFKAQIQAQQAIGQVNEQTVKVYQARLEAVRNQVEIYKASMDGARAQSDLNRNEIEAYKTDVSAYAETINAQKIAFDAYESEMKGVTAQTQIIDSQARAFAATVQGYEGKANIKVKGVQAKIEAMQAATSRFTAQVNAQQARTASQAEVVKANVQAFSADVSRYSAELNAGTAHSDMLARLGEARLRNNLAYYEIQVKEHDQKMGRILKQAEINADALKTAGQMSAQLTAGAYAAMHVSASMSGSAGVSASSSYTTTSVI